MSNTPQHPTNPRRKYILLTLAALTVALSAGIIGVLLTEFLHLIENLISKTQQVPHLTPIMMATAGAISGICWWKLRQKNLPSTQDIITTRAQHYPFTRTTIDAFTQVFLVGAGASIGREAAPRQLAATIAHRLYHPQHFTPEERNFLTAAACGAALGAVYNTPYAGAAYTISIVSPTKKWSKILTALTISYLAVLIPRAIYGATPYYQLPTYKLEYSSWIWVIGATLIGAILGTTFRIISQNIIQKIRKEHPRHWWKLPAQLCSLMLLTAVIATYQPNILGNGVLIIEQGLHHKITLSSFLILAITKPLLTLLSLRAGAAGGTLTPALATGASIGAYIALASGTPEQLPVFMLLGATSLLSASESSALFGALFTIELTHAPMELWAPLLMCSIGAEYLGKILNRHIQHNTWLNPPH
ncbi:chloride channel protein [Rothia sp. CCM 9418]|uniref:chloride channel protein n=1 Tax=Rothia sp. CCM 9418 TaxID=3402661 RepID=UPI003AE40AA4